MNYNKYERIKVRREISKHLPPGDIKRNGKEYRRKDVLRKLVDIRTKEMKGNGKKKKRKGSVKR